jgi:hypothetical protein
MSFVASSILPAAIIGSGALGAGASIFGGITQANAEQTAAGDISSSTSSAIQQLMQLVNQGQGAISGYTQTGAGDLMSLIQQAVGQVSPYSGAGQSVLPTLESLLNPGTASQTLQTLPGYQFSLDTGEWGINNAATATGLGGNVLTAANNYAQGTAQNTYGGLLSALQSLVGTGSGAASSAAGSLASGGLSLGNLFSGAGQSIGSLLGNAGSGIAGLTQTAGQNIASTAVGAANATAGAATGAASSLGGIGNNLLNYSILSKLLGGGSQSMYGINGGSTATGGDTLSF